jgi:hypothetical protein
MKERGILFSAPMVRALLAGTKTQTRRVVKLPHANPLGAWEATTVGGPDGGRTRAGDTIPLQGAIWHTRTGDCLLCPNGMPGDRLWVRESFSGARAYETRGYPLREWGNKIFYWADGNPRSGDWTKPRPSIHMPRCLSRITLELTEVRVERLQDISEADAIAEGIAQDEIDGVLHVAEAMNQREPRPAACAYRTLWEDISGAGSWARNPWVWVLAFRKL